MSITHGVEKHTFDNGLRVLVKEQRAAPVTAVVAHVRAGYFNEPDRWNGISHAIEHMLFKGTRKRPGRERIASDVRALGGSINAGTYYEDTTYYITLPSRHTESAVEILADMLQESLIDPDELAKELEVIIQESMQKRDNPRAMLFETMYEKAYDHHRIRRWRIGGDDTLRGFRQEDLAGFLSQFYVPANIVLSIVGDVAVDAARQFAERHWGGMPQNPIKLDVSPVEPSRDGFRFHRMTGDIQQRLVAFGFPTPPVVSKEAPALMILDAVLSDGRSSRFFQSLKEDRGLVNSASANYEGFEDMGLFSLSAEPRDDDPLAAETGLLEEISRLVDDGIREEELERIKTRIDSRWIFAQEEVMGLARTLSSYEVLGGYHLADEFRARFEAIQAKDVIACARYLDPESATLVEYLPESVNAPARTIDQVWSAIARFTPRPTQESAELVDSVKITATHVMRTNSSSSSSDVSVLALPSGATMLHRMRSDLPVAAVHVLFPGGRLAEKPETAGITNLMLKSALKGTRSHSAIELAQRIERLGASIGLTLAADYLGFSMKLLAARAGEGFGLLKEVIATPTFSPDEIEKEKESIYSEIRRQRDSMFSRSLELFSRARFGTHPYGLPASGEESAITALSEADVRSWHSQWVRSEGAIIAIVGSLTADEALDLFSDAIPEGRAFELGATQSIPEPTSEEVESVDKQQTASVMGFDGASIDSDDRHALDLIAEATSGLAGRFFQAVRSDSALAYAVTSFHRPRRELGIFGTYTATSPDKELLAREIILKECARLADEPLQPDELRDAKAAIHGEFAIHSQTFSAQAAELAVNHLYGLPLNESQRYLARIDKVSSDEIMNAARTCLRPDRYWLGVVRGIRTECQTKYA